MKSEKPIVFISYARTSPEHIEWVVNFTNKLRRDGVDANVDEFNLKLGHDLNFFMEKYIKEETDYVLLMSTKEYVEKANKREGGVGTETQLLSNEVYKEVTQEKIIPVILEYDDDENPYLPYFIETRYGIDLSSEETFDENYKLLLRTIFNEPKYIEEEIGEKPSWLTNLSTKYPKTNLIIKNFDKTLENHPEKFNSMIDEFFSEYHNYLKTYKLEYPNNDLKTISKELYENLENYKTLKNEFDAFLEKIFKIGRYQHIESEIILKFLSNIHSLVTENYNQSANFDFILRETFLHFIAFGLKYENYEFISDIFYSPYYLDEYDYISKTNHFTDLDFRGKINTDQILNNYFNENNKSTINPIGELLLKRKAPCLDKELIDADLLSCYVSYLNGDKFDKEEWFPFMYMYKHRSEPFNLFRKLTSKKFFEKVKTLFDVNDIGEFRTKVISTRSTLLGRGEVRFMNPMYGKVKPIEEYIDLDKIGSER